MRKQLIITADDFGYARDRDRGILAAFDRGAVTRASLLVCGESAPSAARCAVRRRLPLGLHFNITEGYPTGDRASSALVDPATGEFYDKHATLERAVRGLLPYNDVAEELTRQLRLFSVLTRGSTPRYIDGHQHVQVLPVVRDVVAVAAAAIDAAVRIPLELHLAACAWIRPAGRRKFYAEVGRLSTHAMRAYRRRGVGFADAFVGLSTMGADMTCDRLKRVLLLAFDCASASRSRDGDEGAEDEDERVEEVRTVELMTHLGYRAREHDVGCGVGADEFSRSQDREHEFVVLNSQQFKRWLREQDIHLVSFI